MRFAFVRPGTVGAFLAGAVLMCAARPAAAQYPAGDCSPAPLPSAPAASAATPQTPQAPSQPTTQEQAAQQPQVADQGLPAERGAGVGGESFAQTMAGDQIGPVGRIVIRLPNGSTASAVIPLANRGNFKIADNESPRPVDRVFFDYNYYNNIFHSLEPAGVGQTDFHRETVGFEKTLLDGNASIGLRLPFFQFAGDGSINRSDIGDLTIIAKYALINNCDTGNVLSGGVAVTAPTGANTPTLLNGSTVHDTLIQPWGGFIYNLDNLYFIGFSSVVIPTSSQDVTLLFNDLGVGYWLMKDCSGDRLIHGIVPVGEVHITDPLDHRNEAPTNPLFVPDQVVLTGGSHIVFGNGSSLFLGGVIPVTGPKPYDFEAIVQFNLRF